MPGVRGGAPCWGGVLATLLLALGFSSGASAEQRKNGFDLSTTSVPAREILSGGPARDGIPALTHPRVVPAAESPWKDDETVIGVSLNGESRAYPIAILDWHELVNDTLGGQPILVSYCPLCGTGMVFEREIGGRVRSFGVSGLLYQSDVLLYDRGSESLWSQIASEAISGPERGTRLEIMRSSQMSWGSGGSGTPTRRSSRPKRATGATTGGAPIAAMRPRRASTSRRRSMRATTRRPPPWAYGLGRAPRAHTPPRSFRQTVAE